MADVLALSSGMIGIVESFLGAYSMMTSVTKNKTKLRDRMLRDFVIHMQILKFCSGVIKDYTHEGPLMDSVLEVARQCTDIGAKLSEKESTIKKRRIFVLASWDILQSHHEDFVASVSLLHQLVQRSVGRNGTSESPETTG